MEETTYGVNPNEADWYYCAVITQDVPGGTETDYVDGYVSGEEPTREGWKQHTGLDLSFILEWEVRATTHGKFSHLWTG